MSVSSGTKVSKIVVYRASVGCNRSDVEWEDRGEGRVIDWIRDIAL